MRILVLGSDNPSPPINGTRIRNYHLWPELKKAGHEVKLLALTRDPADLQKSGAETEFFMFTRKGPFKRAWMRLFHSYHEWPVSEGLRDRVMDLMEEWKPDVVHAEELRMGGYLPHKKMAPNTLLSICVHNVESMLIKKTLASPFPFGEKFFNRIYQFTLRRFEKRVLKTADVRLTYSEKDRSIYEKLYPGLTFKLSSNGVNLIELDPSQSSIPSAHQLLFLGSLSYLPNIEGLFWLLDHVLLKVKAKVTLTVAGSTPAKIVRKRLDQEQIKLLDTPLELGPIYLANSLLLVPLLSGSGTRGKILEAMMYNRAVLTTSKGIEGLNIGTGTGAIVADGAEDFARAIDEWISMSEIHRQELADRGKKLVMQKYTWKKVGADLLKTWDKV